MRCRACGGAGRVSENLSRARRRWCARLSDVVGKPFDTGKLDQQIGLAYGEGSYERITYDLVDRNGQTGLSVQPVDKGWGPNFLRLGLRLADNFAGRNSYQLFAEANFTGLNSLGGESRNRVQLGEVTELYSEFLQPWGQTGNFYVAPYLQYKAYDFPINSGGQIDYAEYRRNRGLGAFEFGYTPDSSWQLSCALEYGRDAAHLRVGSPDFPNLSSAFGGIHLGGSLEAGGVWDQRRDIGSNLIGAGSVFIGVDTFLGPIFLGYGYAQGGHNAAYLSFGSLLRTNDN